jgi:hypothetical protein
MIFPASATACATLVTMINLQHWHCKMLVNGPWLSPAIYEGIKSIYELLTLLAVLMVLFLITGTLIRMV